MMERIDVNLLPAEYRVHSPRIHLRREIVYPLLFLFAVSILSALVWMNMTGKIEDQKTAISVVERKIAQDKHIHNEIMKLRNEHSIIKNKIHALQKIDINRERWVRLQEMFSRRLPRQTWLAAIEETSHAQLQDSSGTFSSPKLTVRGKTMAFEEVAIFMSALKNSEYIVDVGLSKVEQNTRGKAFDFTISCIINPDAQLVSIGENYQGMSR